MLRQIILLAFMCAGIKSVYSDTNYRLNTTIVPSTYTISITPYFDTGDKSAFTFDGEVTITFVPGSNINKIKLHSEDLTFSASNISLTSGSNTVSLHADNPLQFEDNYTFAHINLQNEISSGVEYVLKITYQGTIRSDLNGFYKNYYIENGVKKWLGATQMEPTHARKVFPCFDEPELKAEFTLIIDRPQNYKPTLTNTKLQSAVTLSNGYVRETFYPTPKMSTYLVAFLVSEFEAGASITVGSNEFGVYSRPDAKNQSEYAFDFGQRVVKALGDFYGIDYYTTSSNLKLDHVALPDFRAGAMENWGLVKYREALLLYLPEESTPYFKYRIAQIIAHETAHMWFGNLVTCHWWSNTWLNEGFANYFQDYITSMIEPDVGSGDMLVIGSVYSAYDADSTPDSPAITNNNVNSPAEISGHFGTITYQKAGSVIRMMHHLIGDEAFKFGLNAYLSGNKFQSGYPEKLYSSLTEGVNNFNSMSNYSGFDITSVMSSWITQAGHPILNVEVNHDDSSITLTQKRFYIDPSHSSDEIYKIPITYTLDIDFNFGNTKPAFIMDSKTYVLPIKEIKENHSWPIFNIQETGLYRVNYDSHTWSHISEHLKGSKREEIHYINRAKIVNDLFALLFADEVQFELLNNVLHFLENETEYAVWSAAIRGLKKLRNHYIGSDTLALVDEFALHLMENIINHLGYEVRTTDDFVTTRNRMQVLEFACQLGHKGCIDNARAMFQDFKNNGKWIDPSLRPVAYCTGLRLGDGDDYDFLWNRMTKNNVANEIWIIGDVLGCTSDETKLNSYLVSMLVENSPIKTQDLTVPLSSVLSNYSHVHVVLEGLQSNISLWKSIYPSLDSVLSTVASALHTQEDFNKYDTWLSSCSECGEKAVASAKAALIKAKAVTTWADNHRSYIWSSLRSDAGKLSAPIMVLVLSVITLTNIF
ncbi:membrane alanyl aminopeptidase-like [Vanessa tameamea]|uniref:Aminopeptidase n=1 Tax=Vanessa tameamea TaxID=334116 RepID=A0A8B8HHI3_VANTA